MKVKKTVAALCMAAIMATSVAASAWVPWEDEEDKDIGEWQAVCTYTIMYSRFSPKSDNGRSGVYVHDINWNFYVDDYTHGGVMANATLNRTPESRKGNSVVSQFWKWERN